MGKCFAAMCPHIVHDFIRKTMLSVIGDDYAFIAWLVCKQNGTLRV